MTNPVGNCIWALAIESMIEDNSDFGIASPWPISKALYSCGILMADVANAKSNDTLECQKGETTLWRALL